ncbi:hypothetical protein A4U61_01350 [Streptomyces sp. H-KF8]|nr:hypothetical protein A4U61_18850 [Streptomyces sp. H-KF8]OBQ52918.1 hypothetical protein A4U61_01350 [Streptomyces sp. H-KF8]
METTRADADTDAVALVPRIVRADHASEGGAADRPNRPDRAPGGPSGHVRDPVLRPSERGPSADEVAGRAPAYRPLAL